MASNLVPQSPRQSNLAPLSKQRNRLPQQKRPLYLIRQQPASGIRRINAPWTIRALRRTGTPTCTTFHIHCQICTFNARNHQTATIRHAPVKRFTIGTRHTVKTHKLVTSCRCVFFRYCYITPESKHLSIKQLFRQVKKKWYPWQCTMITLYIAC